MTTQLDLISETGVFRTNELDELDAFFRTNGFAILRGLFSEPELELVAKECVDAQNRVVQGELASRYGNSVLLDDATSGKMRFTNYVQYITEVSPAARSAILHPAIVDLMSRWIPNGHLREHSRFGVVYQDARGGPDSGYRRIGWHSDWQSGPHRDCWPSVAFTLHIDGTSPDNGFLRVVPGSHKWATPAPFKNANNVSVPNGSKPAGGYTDTPPPYPMPLAFEKARGEIGIYCEAGDILFHDAYLWHSAASATNDRAIRRHVRGGWFSGAPDDQHEDFVEDFVKNAAR